MTSHAEIEASETITRQAITTALKNDSLWLVVVHDSLNDWLEDGLVGGVIDAITKREIDGVVLALTNTNVAKLTSSREVLAILVEGDGHDTIGSVESLLDAITVMDVNVNVEDSLLESQELDDAENDVWESQYALEFAVDLHIPLT